MAGESRKPLLLFIAIALLVPVLAGASAGGIPPNRVTLAAPALVRTFAASGLFFDYVVVIVMENANLCNVYTHCGGTGVYQTSLADNYSIPLNDRYCGVNPSLSNYLCLSGGTTFGCAGYDGNPNTNNCTALAWTSPNIVDRFVAGGLTWKAYMEAMPTPCDGTDHYPYAVRHDPYMYYQDVVGNASRCNRIVPAGPTVNSDSTFLNDLNSTSTASNYMWLTPNLDNDAHDTNISFGDAYLSRLVPQILNSPVFQTQRAVLYLTYDEGYSNPIYTAWAGSVVNRRHTSNVAYTHYSFLKTVEDNWNLPSLTANDGGASNMSEFFKPNFSMSATPDNVWFKPGQSNTSSVGIYALGGFNGTVALTATSSPVGVNTTCVPSSINATVGSTCTFNATTAGNYLVNITGTNGTLAHSVSIHIAVSLAPPPVTTLALAGTLGASGWYVTNVTVTLTATNLTTGSIWYSFNDINWLRYASPFIVSDGAHTLYYNATNGAGVPEPTDTATVNVDWSPPFVTAALVGARGTNGWYVSGVQVTVSAVDNESGVDSIAFALDSGAFQTYSVPFFVTDGVHVVSYFAANAAGLRSAAGALALKVDTAPPTFHALSPSGSVAASPVTVSWNATDLSGISGYRVRVDNGSYQNVGTATSLQLNVSAGPHAVQVVATDNAGLNSAAVIRFEVSAGAPTSDLLLLLVPVLAVVIVVAAFAVGLAVLRARRRRRGKNDKDL